MYLWVNGMTNEEEKRIKKKVSDDWKKLMENPINRAIFERLSEI